MKYDDIIKNKIQYQIMETTIGLSTSFLYSVKIKRSTPDSLFKK